MKHLNQLDSEINGQELFFIPTMGSLHKGHLSLIENAKTFGLKTIVSIFVNPKQFNDSSDYEKYPRDLERDFQSLDQLGVDISDPNAQDDIVVNELHLPLGRKVLFKMRSQDVLHSAYMPHFRAQMNCVPGMITQFAFTPSMTTEDMRMNDEVIEKVEYINQIRTEKNIELLANGDGVLEMYEFDYLLLCNKICGSNHFNMQMKIVVDTEEEYNTWLAEQATIAETIKNK